MAYVGVAPEFVCDCGLGDGRVPCKCMGMLSGMKGIALLDAKSAMKGIIRRLTDVCGGNLHDKGKVIMSSRDVCKDDEGKICEPKNILEYLAPKDIYMSANRPGAWFCFDFRDMRVFISAYHISTCQDRDRLRSWVVQGSLDGTAWAEIDSVCEADDMAGKYAFTTRVATGEKGPFRFIRVLMTGENRAFRWHLCCSEMELFGTLFEPSK